MVQIVLRPPEACAGGPGAHSCCRLLKLPSDAGIVPVSWLECRTLHAVGAGPKCGWRSGPLACTSYG